MKNSALFTWLLCSINALTFADEANEIDPRKSLDWIPIEQLTDKQLQKVKTGCCGAYIAPAYIGLEKSDSEALLTYDNSSIDNTSIESAPIKITAGSVVVKKLQGTDKAVSYTELTDHVDIVQGNRRLQANKAIIDETHNNIQLEGNITLREPDLLFIGDTATIVRDDNTITINNAQYVIHTANIHGSAKKIAKTDENQVILIDGSYTQCPPEDNSWLLKSDQIIIDNEKQQGYAKHVSLLVKDAPVFYFPYLQFPVGGARQSGLLFPSISSSESNGVDIAIPFYLNLAPNYDAVLTPYFLDDHGLLLKSDARYLSRYFYTEATIAYLNNDKGGFDEEEQRLIDNGVLTEAEANPYKGEQRWLLDIQQQGGFNQAWYSTVDYVKVSDDDYLRDLDKTSRYSGNETYLNQQITAGYDFQYWQLGIETRKFQSLIDEQANGSVPPYQQLPVLQANGHYTWQDWSVQLDHEWIRFNNEVDDIITGDRSRINYALLWDNTWQAGFFRPALQLKQLRYVLNDNNFADSSNKTPGVTVPQAIIDTGLFFERDSRWFDHQYLQTFEPRLYYLRSQFKDQTALDSIDFDTADLTFSYDQLFRDDRFSGGDRIGDANQLAVGLTTRFVSWRTGREWLNLSVGRIFYFEDRRVTLNNTPDTTGNSDIASRISSTLNDYWRLSSDLLFNPDNDDITSGNLGLRYRKGNSLFNLDYRYLREKSEDEAIKQFDASLIAPVYVNRWYFIGQNSYDIANSRQLGNLVGIEYNDCCYRIRFAWRRSLDNNMVEIANNEDFNYDRGWFFQVQFRGLGGAGAQLDGIFDRSIDGYNDWEASRQ